MEFSSVVLAAPTIRAVHAVPEAESAAERPAMGGGRGKGQEEEKGGHGAGAGSAKKIVSDQNQTESGRAQKRSAGSKGVRQSGKAPAPVFRGAEW
jgi:hypothetical protein